MELVALLLLLLLLFTTVSGKSHVHQRESWSKQELPTNCVTNCSPLVYMSYGCYYGLGGTGWPRDKTDWCCQKYDCCYRKAKEAGCSPKRQRYNWECKDHRVKCAANQTKCQEMMCECDKEIVHCFATADYNGKYFFFPGHFCGDKQPKCD